jgi:hypothetical protein
MTCDKCGKDFPSQYYLDFKAVPDERFDLVPEPQIRRPVQGGQFAALSLI